jgi:IS30 family transposase
MYSKRRKACRPCKRLDDPILFQTVKEKFLEHQWSPEQIAGRLALERKQTVISYATIYRAIYSGMFDTGPRPHGCRGVIRKLRHRGKTRHTKSHEERRGKIRISNDISQRPAGAANRSRLGHWEGDTVAGVKGKACLVTLVDRKSRYLVGGKAEAKKADAVNEVMIQALRTEPLHSITPDRGKEFAKHAEVTAALDQVKFYFPLPHHPWERGTNENTNGLLREYFPKGKDISDIPDSYIQEKFDELNKRPRKCLGYRTPFEVYHSKLLHLA